MRLSGLRIAVFYDTKRTVGIIFIKKKTPFAENKNIKRAGGIKMSIININYVPKSSDSFAKTYVKKANVSYNSIASSKESVVEDYKRRHPESAAHVNQQVQAGKKVWAKNGVEDVSRDDMSMEEYQKFFHALLGTIPYDSTRVCDVNYLTISDEGWEQMKKDPEYEAWILGYFVEDRSVRNPFFGWGGNTGMVCFERFGASIEEHHGQGFSKSAVNGDKNKKKEESWWDKRRKKTKELMMEQQVKAVEEARAKREANLQEYRNHQLKSQQRLKSFLTGKPQQQFMNQTDDRKSAAEAYENMAGLFQSIIRYSDFKR